MSRWWGRIVARGGRVNRPIQVSGDIKPGITLKIDVRDAVVGIRLDRRDLRAEGTFSRLWPQTGNGKNVIFDVRRPFFPLLARGILGHRIRSVRRAKTRKTRVSH